MGDGVTSASLVANSHARNHVIPGPARPCFRTDNPAIASAYNTAGGHVRHRASENSRHAFAVAGLDLQLAEEFAACLAPVAVGVAFGYPAGPLVGVGRAGEGLEADTAVLAVGDHVDRLIQRAVDV